MTLRLGLGGDLVPREIDGLTRERLGQIRATGVSVLLTHLRDAPSAQRARASEVRERLADAGLGIVQAAGFDLRLIEPDPVARRAVVDAAEEALETAAAIGAEMVISGCGSMADRGMYAPHPDNHGPEIRGRLAAMLSELAPVAEARGVVLAVECHQLTTLDSPEHIAGVFEVVGSEWVRASFDPVNLIPDLSTAYRSAEFLQAMWERCSRILSPSLHVKDLRITDELVVHLAEAPPGDGLLDWAEVWRIAGQLPERSAVIVEHLSVDDSLRALRWVREACAAAGVPLSL